MEFRSRRTKMITTLGPSSEGMIHEVLRYSDVIRINLAHSADSVEKYVNLVEGKVPILMDLPGSKLRVLNDKELAVKKGDMVAFGTDIKVDELFFSLVKDGDMVVLGDGQIRIRIKKEGEKVLGVLLDSGLIYPRQRISIPRGIPYGVTENDIRILERVMKFDPDFIGISFVTSKDDVKKVREIVGNKTWVVSKIEKRESLKNLKEIVKESDALMIARGDLGLEIGLENLPFVQEHIIRVAESANKPVILATQVLDSMIHSQVPFRAEVTDIANSISQGVDAIMLSDETAIGKHPLEAILTLDRLIRGIEKNMYETSKLQKKFSSVLDSIYFSTITASKISKAKIIVVYSPSGKGAIKLSKLKPNVPILALVRDEKIARKLSICYGVYSVKLNEKVRSVDQLIRTSRMLAIDLGLVKKNEVLIITSSEEVGEFLKIERIS